MRTHLNMLCAAALSAFMLTACGESDSTSTEGSFDDELSQLELDNEAAALAAQGIDADDAEADEEDLPEEVEPPADEDVPAPGEDPAAFCEGWVEDAIARCEERRASGEIEIPEDAPACADMSDRFMRRCRQHVARRVRHRIRACHAECRPEAREAVEACMEEDGEREACFAEGRDAAEGCHEACPDAPARPECEGEECPERPERPEPPVCEGEECPEPPACEGEECGERPERPEPPVCEGEECPERPEPPMCEGEECPERPERPQPPEGEAPEEGEEGAIACEDRCAQAARAFYGVCIEEGGEEEICAARAQRNAAQCIAERCADGRPRR